MKIRPASLSDVPGVTACVNAAYSHYLERIGTTPGPMLEDYSEVIRSRQVFVFEEKGSIAGVLVLVKTDEGFQLNNVAVDPAFWGQGIGRSLLEKAESEARNRGYDSIYLYTHEAMAESQRLYARKGYVEYDRRTESGLARVYMRKTLARSAPYLR